jgi:hypothetical protein
MNTCEGITIICENWRKGVEEIKIKEKNGDEMIIFYADLLPEK